jgi:cytochrome b6-f complex iron-sulfur subunit
MEGFMAKKPDGELSRRSFLNILLGTGVLAWAGSVFYPILEYFKIPPRKDDEPASVVAARFADLKPNQGVIFKFGSEPGLLVMSPDGELRAFSAVCTHLDCTVRYRADLQKIHCACHNGIYDLNGHNLSGPPPRPLPQYRVVHSGDDVVVFRA